MAVKYQGGKAVQTSMQKNAQEKVSVFLHNLGMVVTREMPPDADIALVLGQTGVAEIHKAVDMLRRLGIAAGA